MHNNCTWNTWAGATKRIISFCDQQFHVLTSFLANGSTAFKWKLCYHWLKIFWIWCKPQDQGLSKSIGCIYRQTLDFMSINELNMVYQISLLCRCTRHRDLDQVKLIKLDPSAWKFTVAKIRQFEGCLLCGAVMKLKMMGVFDKFLVVLTRSFCDNWIFLYKQPKLAGKSATHWVSFIGWGWNILAIRYMEDCNSFG